MRASGGEEWRQVRIAATAAIPAPSIRSMRINSFDDNVRKISKISHSLALFARGIRIDERGEDPMVVGSTKTKA